MLLYEWTREKHNNHCRTSIRHKKGQNCLLYLRLQRNRRRFPLIHISTSARGQLAHFQWTQHYPFPLQTTDINTADILGVCGHLPFLPPAPRKTALDLVVLLPPPERDFRDRFRFPRPSDTTDWKWVPLWLPRQAPGVLLNSYNPDVANHIFNQISQLL